MSNISNKSSGMTVAAQPRAEASEVPRPAHLAIIDFRSQVQSLDMSAERLAESPTLLGKCRTFAATETERSVGRPHTRFGPWNYLTLAARFCMHADRYDTVLAFVPDRIMALLALAPILIVSNFYHVRTIVRVGGGALAGKTLWYRLLVRRVLRTAGQVVTCSDREAMILGRLGVKSMVISPILPDQPRRTASSIQPHLVYLMTQWSESETAHILGALSIVKQKYPRAALSIAAPREWHTRIRDLARLESRSAEHAITLATEERLSDFLSAGDLCVCAFADSDFPTDLRLAWQCGIPVLAPEFGNAATLIRDHDNGLIYSALNRSSLADRIIEIVETPVLADRLSKGGLAEAERYTWDAVWPQWRRILGVPDPS